MTDTDILLRLRAAIHLASARLAPQTSPEIELMREAADALERMRDEVDLWRIRCASAVWRLPDDMKVADLQDAERFLRQLFDADRKRRWTIIEDGGDLLVCDGEHDKNAACDFVRYVRTDAQ